MAREFFLTTPGGFDVDQQARMRRYLDRVPHVDAAAGTLVFRSESARDAYVATHGGRADGAHLEVHPLVRIDREVTLSTVGGDVDHALRDFAAWCMEQWRCQIEERFRRDPARLDEITWFESEPKVDWWASQEFPAGCELDGGRYQVTGLVHGAPTRGIHRGVSREEPSQRFWITVREARPDADAAMRETLAWPIEGVAPIRFIGELTGRERGYCGLVEQIPDGGATDELEPTDDYAFAVALGLARTVAAAHRRGWTLGGVRPETVFVVEGEDGLQFSGLVPRAIAFLDSDAVSSVQQSLIFGERVFEAPEQLTGGVWTPASDVFCMTAMLVDWVSGFPFGRGAPDEQIRRIVGGQVTPWTGPTVLSEVVGRGLAVDPQQRPSADELVDALERLASR